LTALAGETITLVDETVGTVGGGGQYIYTAEITADPINAEFFQIDTDNDEEEFGFGSLSSIDECGEIQFDNGDLCGGSSLARSGKVTFTNIQTDECTPGGLEATTITVTEPSTCVYEFTIDQFCCPNYDEVSSVSVSICQVIILLFM